jgi:tryptophan halogenase
MKMTKRINNIVVVGGGNAGWAVASLLVDRIHPLSKTKITLIESADIPVIGVGESTTGQVRRFMNMVGHLGNEEEFLKETGSAFKYGIVHSDWKTVGKSFVSPIGADFYNYTRFPHEHYDYMRIYHVANKIPYEGMYQSQCMLQDKVFFLNAEKDNPYREIIGENGYGLLQTDDVGYHLDSFKTGDYLRKKTLATGRVRRYQETVEEIVRNESGYVTELKLSNNVSVSGDLFFDCTGFKRLLKLEDNEFISYKDQLLIDSTIVFPEAYQDGETIKTYTHAKALKNGWMFEIPLQTRIGRGYNFSSAHTDPEGAQKEAEKVLGRELDVKKTLKYETGRVTKFWDKNVISAGLSSGFLEPLEATTLHAVLKQVEHFMENYYSNLIDTHNEAIKSQYNRDMKFFYDDLKDFIVYHYQNTRRDTDFWVSASKPERMSEKLQRNFELWKTRMPRLYDYSDGTMQNFLALGNSLWYQVGLGMDLFDSDLAKQELDYYRLTDLAKSDLEQAKKFSDYCIARSLSTKDYYDRISK